VTRIGYRRIAPGRPPERELLAVEADGSATGWRSNGPIVGRFAGRPPGVEAVLSLAEAALALDPAPLPELPPGAAVETVEAGSVSARFLAGRTPDGPWGELLAACREALEHLAALPLAAVAGELDADGTLRLVHRGSEVLPLELGRLLVRTVRMRDGLETGRGQATPPGLGRVDAGPGWTLEVPGDGTPAAGDGTLWAEVTFVADDGGVYIPMRLSATA
jgi:hypothetical protein